MEIKNDAIKLFLLLYWRISLEKAKNIKKIALNSFYDDFYQDTRFSKMVPHQIFCKKSDFRQNYQISFLVTYSPYKMQTFGKGKKWK